MKSFSNKSMKSPSNVSFVIAIPAVLMAGSLIYSQFILCTPSVDLMWSKYFSDGHDANRLGDTESAQALLEAALRGARSFDPSDPRLRWSLSELARNYALQGKIKQAENAYEELITIKRSSLGPNHPEVAISLTNFAQLQERTGNWKKGQQLISEALAIYNSEAKTARNSGSSLHADEEGVAVAYLTRANLELGTGKYQAAEESIGKSLHLYYLLFGDDYSRAAPARATLAQIYELTGRSAQAEVLLKQTLQLQQSTIGNTSVDTLRTALFLGEFLCCRGRNKEAEELYIALVQSCQSDHNKSGLASSQIGLANVYLQEERPTQALLLFRCALRSLQAEEEAQSGEITKALTGIARCCRREKNYLESEACYKQALVNTERLSPGSAVSNLLDEMTSLYAENGHYAQAVSCIERWLQNEKTNSENLRLRDHLTTYRQLLLVLGRQHDASEVGKRLTEIQKVNRHIK